MTTIKKGDWVLVCETGDKGEVESVLDEGERFVIVLPKTPDWPYPRRMHVMVEKIRKIRTPSKASFWEQLKFF
jgi:ribosomal protein L24